MGRSKWKAKYIEKDLFLKPIKNLWQRNVVIPYSLINKKIFIYNGQEHIKVYVSREKVGYKFGEFSFTRKHKQIKKGKIIVKKGKK